MDKIDNFSITFTMNDNNEIIRFCANGDIFIRGKLTTNDLEVVEGMRLFLESSGHIKPKEPEYPNTLIKESK